MFENRAARRAKGRTKGRAKRTQKLALSAAVLATSLGLAAAPSAQAAEVVVDAVQAAETNNATYGNLIVIADNLGRIQGAMLNPVAALTPTGWLPTSTNSYQGPTTVPLTYVNGLTRAASMLAAQPNTSGVPGIPALGTVATLVPQLAQGVPLVSIGAEGLVAVAQTGAAILGLNVVNGVITVHNEFPGIPYVWVPFPDSPLVTGIPSLDDAIPSATETTSSWVNNFSWPVLQASGSTWMTSDQLVLPNVTTENITDNFDLTVPDPLEHGQPVYGWFYAATPSTKTECTPTLACGAMYLAGNPGLTQEITWTGIKYYWKPDRPKAECTAGAISCGLQGASNELVRTDSITDYDPQDGVDDALGLLDGIDVPGFSITKQEAGGNYGFFGGGAAGWVVASTTVVIPEHGDEAAQVSVVPTAALGFAAPFGLLTVGGLYSPGVVTQSGQSTDSTLGTRSFSVGIPALGVGIDTTSLFESAHIGPDGIAFNSGWTVALINGGPVPIPLVYSLGSFNIGPKGIGYTSPSFFGVGLPDFQLGTNVGTTTTGTALGDFDLPTSLIRLDPKLLFSALNIDDPTGLGLTDPFGTAQQTLSPLYEQIVTPIATPVWQAGADLAGQLTNTLSGEQLKLSGQLADLTGQIADGSEELALSIAGLDQKLTGGQLKALTDQLKEAEGGALVKQSTKLQKSLIGSQTRLTAVTDKLKSGDLSGAAEQVGANVKNRVDRLTKDVKNGVSKVKKAVSGDE